MRAFAQFLQQELGLAGTGEDVCDICAGSDRYAMYRAGPVLSISVSPTARQGTGAVAQPLPHVPPPTPTAEQSPLLFSVFSHHHQCNPSAVAKLLRFAPALSVWKVQL